MPRPDPSATRHVACVGCGTIGAGWAALFLARGLDVSANDPAEGAERRLRERIRRIWPKLEALGLADEASPERLRFTDSVEACVDGAQFVQESAPDDEPLKVQLLARIDAACAPEVVIASSSSKFLPSRLGARCRHPRRVAIGHPFVPSYLVPLVEIVGAADADPDALAWLDAFYRHLGKTPITLKKEIEAYVANRLQFVLLEEAARLVADGVCDWMDVETAVTKGPGFRWPVQGPVLHRHLGGGPGGVRHMIAHFGWRAAPETMQPFIDTVDRRWGQVPMDDLEDWRDQNLLVLLRGLKDAP
jgi:3-hydroxyacyl-CoA dehydrogenase